MTSTPETPDTPSPRTSCAPTSLFSRASLVVTAGLALASPAMAIPSPDVLIGAFASAAQLMGLLTVMAGSFLFSGKRGAARQTKSGTGSSARGWLGAAAALLLLSVGANVLQHTAYADSNTRRLARNLVRSSVENGAVVGDTNLKTLSYSGQCAHPRGITTDDLAARVAAGSLELVDVREPEEVEMGAIAGARSVRYPDLQADPSPLTEAEGETVLLCYSGNRSSELADAFAAQGIECRFVIGGYEKWLAEGRSGPITRDQLRSLPAVPGATHLLDTPEVERLVAEREAVFVDVRYEGDFALGHLPGAINIPLRRLTSSETADMLEQLVPAGRPVIAPCYDKRSSFYASILGVRLHRAGHEFVGRYTVPNEYLVAKALRPHVASWKDTHRAGVLGGVVTLLTRLVEWLNGIFGHLALAIVGAVILLRTVLLPLTLKNERDQLVQRGLAGELAQLKASLRHDRGQQSRAVLGFYRKHNLTPGRNLIGSVVQITLFLLFFGALSDIAAGTTDGFSWIANLGNPDPLFLLPVVLGGLVMAHLMINASKRGHGYTIARCLGAAALAGITLQLSAALNFYLVCNVALMMLQNRLVARHLRGRIPQPAAGPLPARGVTPLRLADRVPGTGGKAIRLAAMQNAGLPVPDGFVVTASVRDLDDGRLMFGERDLRTIDQLWRKLGAERVAVRSSGLNEDGAEQSYAGVFDSILSVRRPELLASIQKVRGSMHSLRAAAYSGGAEQTGGIVVQKMVNAEYAGVLFTEHPSETGSMLVEMVSGLGEALVSGQANPEGYRVGRCSGRVLDDEQPPIELGALVELGRRVEKLFGRAQDIEWAYGDGRFWLLQARDITVSVTTSGNAQRRVFESERRRVLELAADADAALETVFEQTELSELLPRPTPMSLSLMDSLWQAGGSTDLACRELGVPYTVDEDSPPLVTTLFGALYVNRIEERKRVGRGPRMLSSFRLARRATELERAFRDDFLPEFLREVRRRETMDLSRLGADDLLELFAEWQQRFVTETYVQAELINVSAEVYVKAAERELQRHGLSVAVHLADMPATVVGKAMSMLPEINAGERSRDDFVDLFGHRAPLDYELSAPRYGEDPKLVREMVQRAGIRQAHATRATRTAELPPSKILGFVVDRAQRFQALKEEAKHHCLRELALLRRALVALGNVTGLGDDVFYLKTDELAGLAHGGDRTAVTATIEARKAEEELFETLTLSTRVSQADLESLSRDGAPQAVHGDLVGTVVAGDAEVVGRARVITSPEQIDEFEDGEILVARFTDPTWTPLFPRAAAVVTEVGGRLSHAAIVARELDLPAIVGVAGALSCIRSGDILRLHADGHIEREATVEIPQRAAC